MVKLFISYSRVDTAFAELIVERLRRVYGLPNVWYDDELHGGQRWWKAILEQIAACDVFVYLLSNDSVTSPYCQAEFAEALRLQKPVVTVQVRDKTRLSDELSEIQYVDMKRGLNDDNLARLMGSVNKMAEAPKKRRALSSRPTPLPSIPDSESEDGAARTDVETPTLAFQRPASGGDRVVARATIVNGVIVGVLGLIGVIVAALIANLNNASTNDAAIQMAIEATRTRDAEIAIQNITATADSWTDTLTPTLTPSLIPPTPTSTPDPLQAALAAARAFDGTNADWQALYSDGFQRTFEDGVTMVLVPAGCFMMGSTDGEDDEQPVNEQCFEEPFWIDLTEVTQVDFERLSGSKANTNEFDDDQRPVERITWFEAHDFCALRRARQPTEREWEYATRGPDALVYPWGNTWNENNAVWSGNSNNNQTANVGSRPEGASWVGALDMSGNVWEWTSSLYFPYDSRVDREADTGTRTDVRRVLRGSSWFGGDSGELRSATRFEVEPDFEAFFVGFRCARDYASEPISPIATTPDADTSLVSYELLRSGDSIAVCASNMQALVSVSLDLGNNERYSLVNLFPETMFSSVSGCVCLQKQPALFPVATQCSQGNTSVQTSAGDWRNATVTLADINGIIGACAPQADTSEVYVCYPR